jgi:hypothetical protein
MSAGADDDAGVAPGEPPARERAARPACPQCGSGRTQPFTHAGPVARVNMKCTDCGHLFKHRRAEPPPDEPQGSPGGHPNPAHGS